MSVEYPGNKRCTYNCTNSGIKLSKCQSQVIAGYSQVIRKILSGYSCLIGYIRVLYKHYKKIPLKAIVDHDSKFIKSNSWSWSMSTSRCCGRCFLRCFHIKFLTNVMCAAVLSIVTLPMSRELHSNDLCIFVSFLFQCVFHYM